MRTLRALREDGLEPLGDLRLGPTVVLGEPAALVSPVGTGSWIGVAIRSGEWQVLGRPYGKDADQLEEIILVQREALSAFYDLYDAALPLGIVPLTRGRLAILDGPLRLDHDLLRAAYEPDADALPWMLEAGCVVAGIGDYPARVVAHKAAEVLLLAIGLARPPEQQVPTAAYVKDADEEQS